jgi:hypothetical protein
VVGIGGVPQAQEQRHDQRDHHAVAAAQVRDPVVEPEHQRAAATAAWP